MPTARLPAGAAALLTCLAVLAACGDSATRVEPAPPAETTAAATSTAAEPAPGPLEDGRYFGLIVAVETASSPAKIAFDQAELLTGEDAERAAVADGELPAGQPLATEYYVHNPDPVTVDVDVAADVTVTRIGCQDGCEQGLPGDFAGFAEAFAQPGLKGLNDPYRGAKSQYEITVSGGVVVAIDERYLR